MFKKTVIKTAIFFSFISILSMPLMAAQLQVLEPEKQATKLVLIKDTDKKGASESLKLKKQIERQLNVKLKLETNMSRKGITRFMADREITVNEQNSFLSSLAPEQKDRVIFVYGQPSNFDKSKFKSKMKTKSTKSLK
ncbi:hypothetical protein [Kangiella spongicola]|uniref:DUF4174 domain-containing protein n=1 Tax=Kangiella spongicola TaxID=796379 RepID=A0A318D2T0_9GAMM|nr:hypothetical protein [Kangiella spongicola]PXF63271.1 hypothetical protein DL796_07455 [Kangiella spongicola]